MIASTSTLLKHLGAAASVLLLAGALTACSSGSSDQAKGQDTTQKKEMSAEQWQTKFNDCMLDEGIEPPKEGSDGKISADMSGDNADLIMAATEKCTAKIGERPTIAGEEMTKEDEDRLMKIVDCLRKRGHDVPDPKGGALAMPSDSLTPEDEQACFGS